MEERKDELYHNGRDVRGEYKIIKRIGKGGMSNVYLVKDCKLSQFWAMKEILLDEAGERDYRIDAARAEAEILKRVRHAGLPKIIDFFWEDKAAYIVMEYIEGITLEELLQRKQVLPIEEALRYGRQILETLKALHAMVPAIVYGDLKASNVMIDVTGRIRLIDFGSGFERISGGQAIYGTGPYAAPEQSDAMQGGLDGRTDIYCFGMLLHKMLTGEFPIQNGGTRMCENPFLPESIRKLIGTCISISKEERFASVPVLQQELESCGAKDGSIRRKQRIATALFLGSFTASVSLFVVSTTVMPSSGGQFLTTFLSVILWITSCLIHQFRCKTKESFLKGEKARLKATQKLLPGLFLVLVAITLAGSHSLAVKAVREANEVVFDEYGRKVLYREEVR